MNFKIPIGQYDNHGKFNSHEWKLLFKYFSESIDSINIYSYDENELSKMETPVKYDLLSPIDNSHCLYGFNVLLISETILEHIRDYIYSIDWGIQLLYFFKNGKLVSELELEDSNNCVVLYLSSEEEKKLKNVFKLGGLMF